MHHVVTIAALTLVVACGSEKAKPDADRVRLWHTFNPTETAALNTALDSRSPRASSVETTLLPFARAQTILREALQTGRDCPDLARIDATWLPRLARENLLLPVPEAMREARTWLPEARELASDGGVLRGIPQSLDGLAVIYRPGAIKRHGVAWPPRSLDDLISASRTLSGSGRYGLAVRVDGYWFVAFLRAWGVDLPDRAGGVERIDSPAAHSALKRFAALFGDGGVSPPPPPRGNEADDETRRFRAGELAAMVNGPWSLPALQGGERIAVAPFPPGPDGRAAAPRGGQLYVVPKCARRAEAAWKLAGELTAPPLQADWARRFGVVPTSREALPAAGELARQFYSALAATRPLPREPLTADLFDDLNPAIAAVVAGDATPAEALSGVRRAWTRIRRRHAGTSVPAPSPRSTDAGAAP